MSDMTTALWLLILMVFLPASGQMAGYEIGLFFSRGGCEYAAEAIAARAAGEGLVPIGFTCTEARGS